MRIDVKPRSCSYEILEPLWMIESKILRSSFIVPGKLPVKSKAY